MQTPAVARILDPVAKRANEKAGDTGPKTAVNLVFRQPRSFSSF